LRNWEQFQICSVSFDTPCIGDFSDSDDDDDNNDNDGNTRPPIDCYYRGSDTSATAIPLRDH
jgi:hypothetical protein